MPKTIVRKERAYCTAYAMTTWSKSEMQSSYLFDLRSATTGECDVSFLFFSRALI